MKICKACQHYSYESLVENFPLCRKARKVDPVDGSEFLLGCAEVREDVKACGPEGAWFEPKNP